MISVGVFRNQEHFFHVRLRVSLFLFPSQSRPQQVIECCYDCGLEQREGDRDRVTDRERERERERLERIMVG